MHYHPSHGHHAPRAELDDFGLRAGARLAHFHIEGPGFRAAVVIATLETVIGSAPAGVRRAALAWARENRDAVLARWQELNP